MLKNIQQLKNHQGFMKYFKNTSWLFLEKVFRIFVGLFVSVWIARYLGPEQFGLFSYAQSFVALFSVIATLGLNGIVVRELLKCDSKAERLIATSFWLKLVGAFIVLIILTIAINFTSNDSDTNALIFIIASATVFQSFNVIDFYFQSKVLSKYVVFANMFALLFGSIVKVILILYEAPLVYFALVILLDSIVLAIGFIYIFLKKSELNFIDFKFDKHIAVSLLKDSWPLMLSSMVISVYMKIDQVMIQEILSSKALGEYAAAIKLSELSYFIPVLILNSIFPAIIQAKKKGNVIYYDMLLKLYTFMVWSAIFLAIPTTIWSDELIYLFYGIEFANSSEVLSIHIWSAVFVYLLHASGRYLIIENLAKEALYRNLGGVCLNIVLNIYFIKHFGIVGAAWSTLISYMFAGFLYDFFSKKLKRTFYLKTRSFLFKGKI